MDHAYGAQGARLGDLRKLAVIQSLHQAGAVLDHLFLDATERQAEDAIRIADAAQAVRRALVALT